MTPTPRRHPVWSTPVDSDQTFPDRGRFDVVIVGAGIAGLSTAYQLCRGGARVLVVDDGPIAGGQSSCTSAHLSSVLDDRFTALERSRGREAARLAAESHAAAIDAIEQTIAEEGISCAFRRVDGFLFPDSRDAGDQIHAEYEAARRAGLEVEKVSHAPLTGAAGPCLRFARQAQFEPLNYLAGLAVAIRQRGGVVVTGVHVRSVKDGRPAEIVTTEGKSVVADAIVVATNAPVIDRFALQSVLYPYMTYVVALTVPTGEVPAGLYWDTADPYHYVRTTAGPQDATDTLIVGGEDHRTGHASDHEERFQRLEAWARDHAPQAGEVTHRWAGQVLETPDGLAFIGRNPGQRHVYVVTGDSGMGLTHGTIAGLLLPDVMHGRPNRWAELYSPARMPLSDLGTVVRENASSVSSYASWLTPGEVRSVADVPPGTGAIVRDGLVKLAVYRAPDGTEEVCSAICPHLGSVVTWNAAERTWDCPAHGSRFDCKGRVIQGPANCNLEPSAATAGRT